MTCEAWLVVMAVSLCSVFIITEIVRLTIRRVSHLRHNDTWNHAQLLLFQNLEVNPFKLLHKCSGPLRAPVSHLPSVFAMSLLPSQPSLEAQPCCLWMQPLPYVLLLGSLYSFPWSHLSTCSQYNSDIPSSWLRSDSKGTSWIQFLKSLSWCIMGVL